MARQKYLLGLLATAIAATASAQSKPLNGFGETDARKQYGLEEKFDAAIRPDTIGYFIKTMSARPHHVGSPYGKTVAEFIAGRLRDWGYDVRTETYYSLFPTPKTRLLEMTGPVRYRAVLAERPTPADGTSNQTAEQLPPYNCWSADGDVTGELVFVNYGLPADYDYLARLGVDVKGKIVIAKYGRSWRGIKPKVAQEHGAIGCLIYSDPNDDGYTAGEEYPKGPWKNEYMVQRGSVMDMPVYPGDPVTPGYASTKDAPRIDRREAANLLKIPVLPISAHDAAPLLRALEGPVAPRDWAGSLPFTYHIGPGKSTVHLKLAFDWATRPLYDVIAVLRGAEQPDEWVIRGNHHDAWVNGADDPVSGQAAMLEEARAVGQLARSGWRPKRSIVYCAWDGEEPALLGSTEWVEDHLGELREKTVAYINSDGYGRGYVDIGGSAALEEFTNQAARDVTDPETGLSVQARKKESEVMASAKPVAERMAMLEERSIDLVPLGSGSDFSPFLQHAGVPTLNIGFGGEDAGGEYHSIFDSWDNFRRFKDPSFRYGAALAATGGRLVLRLADAGYLPFDYTKLQKQLAVFTRELIALADEQREATKLNNRLIREKYYANTTDTALRLAPPPAKDEVPYLDFTPLQTAVAMLERSAHALAVAREAVGTAARDSADRLLFRAEQQLLLPEGLPRRAWYKHVAYAPGMYTGYGVKTMPGIREAIEQRDWKEAAEQIRLAGEAITRLAGALDKAASVLASSGK